MRQTGVVFAVALAILGVFAGGGTGCTVLLETDTNPYKCMIDADCTRYPAMRCATPRASSAWRACPVPARAGPTGGAGGTGGTGGLTCQLSFDNRSRVPLDGPDGGLRPLPEAP